jgi:hypothetical protein
VPGAGREIVKDIMRICFVALVLLAIAPAAVANGAFPDEFSVHFPVPSPHRILLGANFGLIISEDDGATWRYACEPWVTEGSDAALSQASVDFYQVCADGAVLAQSIHVTRSSDDGCTWPQSAGVITDPHLAVVDLFPDPNDATFVIAVQEGTSGSALVVSHDGGVTFVGPSLLPLDAIITGIEISETLPTVVYATSFANATATQGDQTRLWRSEDKGVTWTSTLIPEDQSTEPRIMAVDPANSDIVYLRVIGALSDSVVITEDQGQTFTTPLTINGKFTSFLRATDGTLYAGSSVGNLYSRAPGATTFSVTPGPLFRCLGQRPGSSRIYACGDFTIDPFSLGYSDDRGATFHRVMDFTDILGPLTCSTVATNCESHWARIQSVLGIGDGGTGDPSDAGVTIDAGTNPSDGGVSTAPASKSGCSTGAVDAAALMALTAIFFRRRRS